MRFPCSRILHSFYPLFCLATSLSAQTTGAGTITGTITDPSGAVIPAAAVAVKNTATQAERPLTTNEAGILRRAVPAARRLRDHRHQGRIRQDGAHGLTLQVGQIADGQFRAPGAESTETVTVTGDAAIVDTEKTEMSQVVSADAEGESADRRTALGRFRAADAQRHHRWRHAGWSPIAAFPDSTTRARWMAPTTARRSSPKPRAAPRCGYVYSMDSDPGIPGGASNYSAELGQAAGGVVNAVTKSGTNATAWRPVLLPALSHAERARSDAEVARHLHAAGPPAAAVRRQRGRTDHQGQAVLLLHLRRFAQGQPDQLHQHFVQRPAALPGGDSGRHVRRGEWLSSPRNSAPFHAPRIRTSPSASSTISSTPATT